MSAKRLPYGPIDRAALTRFEGQLSGPLPRGLRQFLLESNGALFSDARELEDVPGGTALQEIFGLHTGPEYLRLDHMSRQMAGSIPESILVFAADAYENYFGISLSGGDSGAVYFIDHETMPAAGDSMIPVAKTFAAFLERSGGDFADTPAATTIAEAIDSGDNGALTHLLAAGADASGAVHHAVRHGDLRILETVLRQGADPNERGAIGGTETPLFVAARQGRVDMADALVRYGADPNLRCGANGTALQMAKPWPEAVKVLRGAGAKS